MEAADGGTERTGAEDALADATATEAPIEAPIVPSVDQPAAFYRALVEGTNDMVAVFASDGTIVYVSPASAEVLGHQPADLVGRNALDLLHPDELERSIYILMSNDEYGSPAGTAGFVVRAADGSYVPLSVVAGDANVGGEHYVVTSSRTDIDRQAMLRVLERLLSGAPLDEALAPVTDVFTWEVNGSHIGMTWTVDGTRSAITTGVPTALVGLDRTSDTPWDVARASGPVLAHDLEGLDSERRALAEAAGMAAYWIEPINPGTDEEPGLITVWTRAGGRPPINHASGMGVARSLMELILRYSAQRRQIDHAATHDALTGLANRRAFFEAVDASTAGGALLYCDLDRFKPINDSLGHAAGDEILRQVAVRLRTAVRSGDVVARLGGDEFAVLLPGASRDEGEALAARLRDALVAPFTIGEALVELGISVGVSHRDGRLGAAELDAADAALYRDKSARRDP